MGLNWTTSSKDTRSEKIKALVSAYKKCLFTKSLQKRNHRDQGLLASTYMEVVCLQVSASGGLTIIYDYILIILILIEIMGMVYNDSLLFYCWA